MHMVMVQYSRTEIADDDSSDNDDKHDGSKYEAKNDDSTFTCWCCKRSSTIWHEEDWRKVIAEEDAVEIDDEDVWCCTNTSHDI